MATAEMRSVYAPLMGSTTYRANKFETPYGFRPDVEKKEVIEKQETERLPKIVLRDSTGQQLNTFTTLQEAIYRAELNVRKSRVGATAEEWRLPHGPLPAKPDFSRVGPSVSSYRQKMSNLKKKNRLVSRSLPEHSRYKEVDVDDVAFVAQSLNHLPNVPSLSFLRQEFLAQPKRYFPIVHSILLHQKLLSETDRREPEYTFPGFCFGCRKHMLCPGCDRTSKPHYHLDNLYKTTGGLTQARTLQEELKKNYGDNWRLSLPDLLVRKTSKVPSLTKEEMQLIEEELDRTLRSGESDQAQKSFLPPITSAIGQGEGKKTVGTASGSVETEDEGILVDGQSIGYNDEDTPITSSRDPDRGRRGSRYQSSDYDIDKDSDNEGRSGSRGRSRQRKYNRNGPRSHTTGSGQEMDDDEDVSGYTISQRSERKGRLYKAPAPFKLKQRKRRMLKSQSPFTTDRNLNIPTGPGFKLKENSKETTKFMGFERKGSSWKEPSKFEVQRSNKDVTKFWSPRSQKKKKQHEKRGRHVSPDSGLDSDKMAESEECDLIETKPKKCIHEVEVHIPRHSTENYSDCSDSTSDLRINSNLDLVSLTSAEPSLDLNFDAAVDLDEIDFIIEDLPEIDSMMKKTRKKHRKKHRKIKQSNNADKGFFGDTERGDNSTYILQPTGSTSVELEGHEQTNGSEKHQKQNYAIGKSNKGEKVPGLAEKVENEENFLGDDSVMWNYTEDEMQKRSDIHRHQRKKAYSGDLDGENLRGEENFLHCQMSASDCKTDHKRHSDKGQHDHDSSPFSNGHKLTLTSKNKDEVNRSSGKRNNSDSDIGGNLGKGKGNNSSSKRGDNSCGDNNDMIGEELLQHFSFTQSTKLDDKDGKSRPEYQLARSNQEHLGNADDFHVVKIHSNVIDNERCTRFESIDEVEWNEQYSNNTKRHNTDLESVSSRSFLDKKMTNQGQGHNSEEDQGHLGGGKVNIEDDIDVNIDGEIRRKSRSKRESRKYRKQKKCVDEKIRLRKTRLEDKDLLFDFDNVATHHGDEGLQSDFDNVTTHHGDEGLQSDFDNVATHHGYEGLQSDFDNVASRDCPLLDKQVPRANLQHMSDSMNATDDSMNASPKDESLPSGELADAQTTSKDKSGAVKIQTDIRRLDWKDICSAAMGNQDDLFPGDNRNILCEGNVDGEGPVLNERNVDGEGPVLNERNVDGEGTVLNEGNVDGEGPVLNERNVDGEGPVLNEGNVDGEGPVLNERNVWELVSEIRLVKEENGADVVRVNKDDVNQKKEDCQRSAIGLESIDGHSKDKNSEMICEDIDIKQEPLIKRKIIMKKKKKDVVRPSDYRLKLHQCEGTRRGSQIACLEGIAEDRQKNKSFPDADEYANQEDEVLTFISTIRSDTDTVGFTTKSLVADRELLETNEESQDLEESHDTQPVFKDTKYSQLNVLSEVKNLNVSNDTEKNAPSSISKTSQKQNLHHATYDSNPNLLSCYHEVLRTESSGNVPFAKPSLGEVASQNSNQDDRCNPLICSDIKVVVNHIDEELVNITQNASENIITGNELPPIDSTESKTHNEPNNCRSVDLNSQLACEREYRMTDLADLERSTKNFSEVSVSEEQNESENSEIFIESFTKIYISEDEGQNRNSTHNSSHSSLQQEVTSDPDCDSELHLCIRSFGESVKEDDQQSVMPSTIVPEKPKPQLVSTPSSQRIATELESPPLTSTPLSLASDFLTWSKFTTGPKVTTPPVLPHITERPPPVKKEKVKKVRREVKDHDKTEKRQLVNGDRSHDFSQVQLEQEQEVTLINSTDELPPLTNGHVESPELPPMEIPPLPEYVEEKKEVKIKEDKRTLIKPLPKQKEAKLPPPPALKGPKKSVLKTGPKKKARVPSAEAPVTQEELSDMTDPLDFLTKYCIIHMDRLPFYERIFSNVVETQTPRYERVRPLSPRTGMPLSQSEMPQWGKHELGMFRDLVVISRGQDPDKIGLSPPEQYLEKICYTLEILTDRRKDICACLGELESSKTKKLAERAKEVIKDIIKPNFTPKTPKKGKKKKKKKGQQSVDEPEVPPVRLTLDDITDEIIVSRIDEKTMKMLCKEEDICQINLEMERCNEKLDNIEERMLHLDGEKNILGMYCMEVYFLEQLNNQKPVEFRRAQSALYNKIHPHPDVEMNVDELEGSLQIINNNLLSTKEFEYLFHVLNLPGRRKLNFKLFSIVAALSEKVTQMDPVVRKLINKMDYHALDHKMNRSKDLFALICDGEPTPRGNATASNLAVELTAGGLTPEHVKVVLSKFNREGSGYIDFMDFVMYIPLFIEIHERIVQNPLDVRFTL